MVTDKWGRCFFCLVIYDSRCENQSTAVGEKGSLLERKKTKKKVIFFVFFFVVVSFVAE